ncbi:unnamed protein product [Rangifer tarandus platyrhynchus]|uniref:Uncharacterized protein n=1 Tax=Rangifer tarandus platyrhynchus TaxID=3082113 RepID=A0ABN8Y5R4_RANTA|nr:unnamed protein product [Rangifer tarandus platyrhynchus]
MSIKSVMPSNHLILCHPLLLLPSVFPSIRVFSNESAFPIRWPKYWSFSFSISPSKEHPGLISFWMDWLDLLAVQGTLKSLLQHHSSKASIHTTRAGSKCCFPDIDAGPRQRRAQGESCHQLCSYRNRTELFYKSPCLSLFIFSSKCKFSGLDN